MKIYNFLGFLKYTFVIQNDLRCRELTQICMSVYSGSDGVSTNNDYIILFRLST